MAGTTILMVRMTTMPATSSPAPLTRTRNLPARNAVRSLVRPALAVAAALVAMAVLLALRFGLYAATHPGMPAVVQLLRSR